MIHGTAVLMGAVLLKTAKGTHGWDSKMRLVFSVCANKEEDSASVILTSSKHQMAAFPPGSPVYYKKHNAVAALGDISPSAGWILEIRR